TTDSAEGISVSIQDFLITFEMVMGSIAHWYAFSFKDYIDPNYRSGRMPIRYAFKDCMGFKDVLEDTLETIRGSRFNYRTFEPAEGMAYIGPSRTARIMAGLRFTGGGSGKYWLPGPNNSRSSLSSERADDDDKNSLNFPDPTPDDEVETMYDYSRRLGRFGDYNFPNKKGKARAKDIFNNNDDDNEEYDFFEDDELINNRIRNGSSSKNRQLSDPNVSPFRIGCIDLVREIPNSDGKRFERFIDRIESSSSSKSFNKINDYAPQTLQTPNEPLSAYESDVTTDDETEYIDRKEFNNSANSNESKSIKKKKDQILAIDEYGFVYDVSEEEIPPGADRIKRIIQAPGTEEKTTRVIRLYREREAKWLAILGTMDPNMARDSRKIKKLVRLGVPESVRGKSWQFMAGAEKYRKSKYYDELRNRPELPIYDVIERDINRCYPDHIQFRKETEDLHDILRAYAHYNPDIGYCQGMGRLVGMMLMQMPAEDTFWLLVATIDGYMSGYYTPTLTQIRIDAFVFEQLLAEHDPKLSQHLIDNDIIPLIYMTQWFMTLFTMTLPWASVLRIWDIFYFEGTNLFFRVGLAILDCVRDHILKNCPTSSEILSFILHIPHELLTPDPLLEATFKIKLKGSVIRRLAKKAAMIESGKENNNNSESADKSSSNNTSTSKKLKQSKSSENVKVNGVEFKLVGE
ncbi:1689_t:CDS:2, partial [Entrophospora sp. SA101]